MASFNRIILLGNIVRDPELRYTQGDLPVARTALAVNRTYKGKEEVMFIDIVVFGKQAENLQAYVTKGSPLLVEGRLSQNSWEQDGQKRSKHEVIVDNYQFIGGRRDRNNDEQQPMHNSGNFSPSSEGNNDDDDIPF